jgi:putative cell wall-binding protein
MSSIPRALRLLSSGVAVITVLGAGLVGAPGVATAAVAAAAPAAVHASPTVDASVPSTLPAILPSNVQRISGASRFDTAIATSQDEFPLSGSAAAVVLTRADTYPDALAGVPLAASVRGPLLLTSSNSLSAAVRAEIVRVLPAGGSVYVLGGTSAVSAAVETTITGLGFVVHRLAGANRFATAVAVAGALGNPTTVLEATGLNFPDALAGGPAAIEDGAAILLTNGKVQAAETKAYLAAHSGGSHFALGGPAAAADPSAVAIAGSDRYQTAADVAETFFHTPDVAGIATGTNFPDALAAGPDLAAKDAPLLLVPPTGVLPPATTSQLLKYAQTLRTGLIFGGTASVADSVATQVGTLANLGAATSIESTSPTYSRQFGILSTHLRTGSGTGSAVANTTQVFDGSAGSSTLYTEGKGSKVIPGTATRSDFNAFSTNNPAALEASVNSAFAAVYTSEGYTSTDPDAQFLVNAEQVLLNPLASPTLRLAVYVALANLPGTGAQSGVKDANGRIGVSVFGTIRGIGGSTPGQAPEQLVYIFDPTTGNLLEDDITADSAVLVSSTVTTFTTAATAPADPYPN